jgi:class 3 adenylate cyclase
MNIIDKSPTGEIPEGREQDVSVLFIDLEGYTRLCENLGSALVAQIIEKCFSVFMDAIYENEGDVNETAGDGLMVLFLNEDSKVNATQAIRAAIRIKEEARRLREGWINLPEKVIINMGINSGKALVGAARFESYTGSRWTYTARGSVTNIAARLGGLAKNGQIFLSRTTSERVGSEYNLDYLGKFQLKNVSGETDVYEIKVQGGSP